MVVRLRRRTATPAGQNKTENMITNMKNQILRLLGLVALIATPAFAQSDSPPPTVFESLQNVFDSRGTNSLMNAGEVNVSTLFKWNTLNQSAGGAGKLDWWISPQQGAFFGFEEYANGRDAYWTMGYQARAVFKGLEVSMGIGTRQNTSDPLGSVQLFLTPTLTKQIYAKGNWDIRICGGCDVMNNGGKPNPFFGVTFRAFR